VNADVRDIPGTGRWRKTTRIPHFGHDNLKWPVKSRQALIKLKEAPG